MNAVDAGRHRATSSSPSSSSSSKVSESPCSGTRDPVSGVVVDGSLLFFFLACVRFKRGECVCVLCLRAERERERESEREGGGFERV